MAKKKNKKIPEFDISSIKNLTDEISGITGDIEEQLKPLMQLNDLQSHIDKLKNTYETASDTIKNKTNSSSEDEGETCAHGNAWHSGCVECDDLSLIDNIFDIVDNTPNDMELGGKIRTICNEFRKDYTDTESDDGNTTSKMRDTDTADNKNQMDFFEDSATKDRKRWAG
jgi:hypothetical protein